MDFGNGFTDNPETRDMNVVFVSSLNLRFNITLKNIIKLLLHDVAGVKCMTRALTYPLWWIISEKLENCIQITSVKTQS